MTTKVHALVDALGNPVNLMLTPGQDHDLTCAQPLLENADPRALIGDKAYDADALIGTLNQRAILPVIPPKADRKVKRECDFVLYCERNLIERFFNKIKHYRAIATRYDKLARNFLAAVQLVAAIILLNSWIQPCTGIRIRCSLISGYGPCGRYPRRWAVSCAGVSLNSVLPLALTPRPRRSGRRTKRGPSSLAHCCAR